jgi:TetR/AcrR family transcriptional repressor of uid operon
MTERILDGAIEQLASFGLRHFSVEDVARRVGINRITIYRRFAGKDELLREVIFREARRLFDELERAIGDIESPEDQLVEGFAVGLELIRSHPVVVRLLASEPSTLASLAISHGGVAIALARAYLSRYISEAEAELAIRLGLSFVLVPDSCVRLETRAQARAFARRYLRR